MAAVIIDQTHQQTVTSVYSWWRSALIGGAVGLAYWVVSVLVSKFVIDPLFCRSTVNALACSNSVELSGNIANILVATAALALLVRLSIARPLVVVVASAIVAWGLAGWTEGLVWAEAAAWSILLFGLSYLLFSWISRYSRSTPVLIAIVLVVLVARIILAV